MEPPPKRRRVLHPIQFDDTEERSTLLRRSPFHSWNKTGGKQAQDLHKRHSQHFAKKSKHQHHEPEDNHEDEPPMLALQYRQEVVESDTAIVTAITETVTASAPSTDSSSSTTPGQLYLPSLIVSAANVASSLGLVTISATPSTSATLAASTNRNASSSPQITPTPTFITTSGFNATSGATFTALSSSMLGNTTFSALTTMANTSVTTTFAGSSSCSNVALTIAAGSSGPVGSVMSIDTSTSQTNPSSSTSTTAGGMATATSQVNGTGSADLTDTGSASSVPTPTVVGSVVGGVAGLTVFLLAALLFLRRYKKRRKAQQALAPASSRFGPTGSGDDSVAGAPVAGFIRRMSKPRSLQSPPDMQERSFERLSGRKLPSQFSPGAEGPTREPIYPSGSSRYPSGGTWLSSSTAENPFDDPADGSNPFGVGAVAATQAHSSQEERYMPGPAKTPEIHQGTATQYPHLRSPTVPVIGGSINSPRPAGAGPSSGRNQPSFDGSRGSRFTEDIV